MTVTGSATFPKVKATKIGQECPNTKAISKMASRKGKDTTREWANMNMTGSSLKVSSMEKEGSRWSMDRYIKVPGKMGFSMDLGSINGPITPLMKVTLFKA